MASKSKEEREGKGQKRKRHNLSWSCKELENAQKRIAEAKGCLKALNFNIGSSEASCSNHLQSLEDEVNAAYEGKLQSVKDEERDEIRLINEEADEEIRIINEKRERRIKACKEKAKKQRTTFKESEARLILSMKKGNINEKVVEKIGELRSKNQLNNDILDNLSSKIENIKQDDETVVNETHQVIASLDESLISNVHEEVADCLERIKSEVQRVKFIEGVVGGEHYGRLDGYIGKWEPVESIDIPSIVNTPSVCGFMNDDEICVLDKGDNAMYVANISTKHTEKVIERFVTACAPVDSNAVACGTDGENTVIEYITLYDRQWNVIRKVELPNASHSPTSVDFDVDRDGMILAANTAIPEDTVIYVINPADGELVNTIIIGLHDGMVWGGLQALPSGDIVVKTNTCEFTVISRSGEVKDVIHCDDWPSSRCYVDKLTDTIYITYEDTERGMYFVDHVSRDGNIQAKRIVEYKQSGRSDLISPCLVTPSGNLVVCDGDKLLVYKKSFIL